MLLELLELLVRQEVGQQVLQVPLVVLQKARWWVFCCDAMVAEKVLKRAQWRVSWCGAKAPPRASQCLRLKGSQKAPWKVLWKAWWKEWRRVSLSDGKVVWKEWRRVLQRVSLCDEWAAEKAGQCQLR